MGQKIIQMVERVQMEEKITQMVEEAIPIGQGIIQMVERAI